MFNVGVRTYQKEIVQVTILVLSSYGSYKNFISNWFKTNFHLQGFYNLNKDMKKEP